jgi:hypothetical protein
LISRKSVTPSSPDVASGLKFMSWTTTPISSAWPSSARMASAAFLATMQSTPRISNRTFKAVETAGWSSTMRTFNMVWAPGGYL